MIKVKIENKSNVTIHGLKPGDSRMVNADDDGNPLEKHWRRRLNDNKIDGAIVKAEESKNKEKTKDKDKK